MIIRIQNPEDTFDLFQIMELSFKATSGQDRKKTLFFRVKKYKDLGDGTNSESDEPMIEFFIQDIYGKIGLDIAENRQKGADALSACIHFVSDSLTNDLGIATTVEV